MTKKVAKKTARKVAKKTVKKAVATKPRELSTEYNAEADK